MDLRGWARRGNGNPAVNTTVRVFGNGGEFTIHGGDISERLFSQH